MAAPTPPYRAGTRLWDDTQSGFARVNVLGQDQLFPNEGYQFPTNRPVKNTRTYKQSEDSPFSTIRKEPMVQLPNEARVLAENAPKLLHTEQVLTKTAYRAIRTPTDGELRPTHSKIVIEAVRKERDAQTRFAEQVRLARMEDEAYWTDVERDEGKATIEIGRAIAAGRRARQQDLAADYRDQFAQHDRVRQFEKQFDRLEGEQLRRMEVEDAAKEQQKQQRLQELARQKTQEFTRRNDELLQRKQARIEDDILLEQAVQQQNAAANDRMEARRAVEKKRRDDQQAVRDRVIEKQSKALEELTAKQKQQDSVAESELAQREEAERQRRLLAREDANRRRRADWWEHQRKRDTKMTNVVEAPDFDNRNQDLYRKTETMFRAKRARTLQDDLRWQMEYKKQKEAAEEAERRANPDTMYFLPDNEW
jgi:hypothetical protein